MHTQPTPPVFSSQQLKQVFDAVPLSLFVLGLPEKEIVACNEAAVEMFGYGSQEELKGRIVTALLSDPRQFSPGFSSDTWTDYQFLNSGHHIFWGKVKFKTIVLEERECLLMTLTESNQEKMLALTKELIEKNSRLQHLAYITSHNIRKPVANILGLVDILKSDLGEKADGLEVLNLLESSCEVLDQVLRDINKLSDQRRIIQELREEVVLPEVLMESRKVLYNDIAATGTVIESDLSGLPAVYSVKSYIRSLFNNMITNAMKYRDPERSPRILVKSWENNGYAYISFTDNGLGLDLEKKGAMLFNMYRRFHNHVEGKGLGLYIVKEQIEALGGRMEVTSQLGAGSTFTAIIPLSGKAET